MFRTRHPQVGARPGTLVFSDEPVHAQIHIIRYSTTEIHELCNATAADIKAPESPQEVVWIDIEGIEHPEVLNQVAKEFQLSPLTMEDIVNVPQRPKTELLDGQQLFIAHTVEIQTNGQLRIDQLSLLQGPNYVVTIHRKAGQFLNPIRRRLQRIDSRLRQGSSDYLTYAVIDTVVDGYYPVLEWFGEELERLESEALERPHPDLLRAIHRLRTQLIQVRRSSWPMREGLEALITEKTDLVSEKTDTFLRDTLDHCAQIVDVVEMYRESAGALINTYMSAVAHRSNEIMKVLTLMSSIFVPLTFIAGIYGMNFQHMPELEYRWAYPAAWAVMLITASIMLLFFYRRGWFGKANLHIGESDNRAIITSKPASNTQRSIEIEENAKMVALHKQKSEKKPPEAA